MTIEYHLEELRVGLDLHDPSRVMPELQPSENVILDVGCGVGQMFLALGCTDRTCIGIDVNEASIQYGMKHHGNRIHYILSNATRIPLPARTIDLVCSRVSLPYMDIPRVIQEFSRVLKVGGRVWMTLHSQEHARKCLKASCSDGWIRPRVYYAYVMLNGYCLKHLGLLLPFTKGRYESWQDIASMCRMLVRHHFDARVQTIGNHTIIEGTLLDV